MHLHFRQQPREVVLCKQSVEVVLAKPSHPPSDRLLVQLPRGLVLPGLAHAAGAVLILHSSLRHAQHVPSRCVAYPTEAQEGGAAKEEHLV